MKLLWTGSDVLFATRFVKHSLKRKWFYMFGMMLFARIADLFVEQHYVVSFHLIKELEPLRLRKKIGVLVDPPKHIKKYPKKGHEGFNVLYYLPKGKNWKYLNWVYGHDLMEKVKVFLPGIRVIEIDGSQDMEKIYPVIDFYARPNRHDGNPRMIMECVINDIPYYWSKSDPGLYELIKKIIDCGYYEES